MKARTAMKSGKGLGDCLADIAHALKLDDAARKFEQVSEQPCGCKERQKILNKLVSHVPFT